MVIRAGLGRWLAGIFRCGSTIPANPPSKDKARSTDGSRLNKSTQVSRLSFSRCQSSSVRWSAACRNCCAATLWGRPGVESHVMQSAGTLSCTCGYELIVDNVRRYTNVYVRVFAHGDAHVCAQAHAYICSIHMHMSVRTAPVYAAHRLFPAPFISSFRILALIHQPILPTPAPPRPRPSPETDIIIFVRAPLRRARPSPIFGLLPGFGQIYSGVGIHVRSGRRE